MMKYKNRSDYSRDGFSHGEFPKVANEYGFEEEHGKMVLKKVGESNRYLAIQQAIPEVSLSSIINRLMKGDTKAIGDVVANYVDVVNMPKTLQEAQNLMIFSERYFDSLPKDVREKYQNDIGGFLQAVDTTLQARAVPAPVPAVENNPGEVVKE